MSNVMVQLVGDLKMLLFIIGVVIASALTDNIANLSTSWGVLTTVHTINLAKTILNEFLKSDGIQRVKLLTTPPRSYDLDKYIVIGAHAFKQNLPPLNKTYIYQVEQHTSGWFTEWYQSILHQALGVIEYNQANFAPLTKLDLYSTYSRVWYLPAASRLKHDSEHNSKSWDVLFYGAFNDRRLRFLESLRNQTFSHHVVSSIYGDDMLTIIQKARVVVNIHYYDRPSLEVPRLVECMSVGVPVVTEWTEDLSSFPYLLKGLKTFEFNSTRSMTEVIQEALANPIPQEVVMDAARRHKRLFSFMLTRFLVGIGEIPISSLTPYNTLIQLRSYDHIVVSLPETAQRHEVFKSYWKYGRIYSFVGVRYTPGWYGCAMTYKILAQATLRAKKKQITIMEDDVVLPEQYLTFKAHIDEYLQTRNGNWDIFCGIIADLPSDVQIKRIDIFRNMTFLTINKMTSMVYNIYNQRALQVLASWGVPSHVTQDQLNSIPVRLNYTIDRVLEQSDLTIITTIPFYISHREELYSTLWNASNTVYKNMFTKVNKLLQDQIEDYYQGKT